MRFISPATGVERSRNQRKTIVGRKLTAAWRPAGNSAAMRPVMGATMSQKPMMKNPIRTAPSSFLFTFLPIDTRICFVKVTFFFGKTTAPPDFLPPGAALSPTCATLRPTRAAPRPTRAAPHPTRRGTSSDPRDTPSDPSSTPSAPAACAAAAGCLPRATARAPARSESLPTPAEAAARGENYGRNVLFFADFSYICF